MGWSFHCYAARLKMGQRKAGEKNPRICEILKMLLLLLNGWTANCVGRRGRRRLSRRGGAGRVGEGDEGEGAVEGREY